MAYVMQFPKYKKIGGETMEKNNGKVIAIVALVVAVVALSAGFAAFTAVLNITSASATVKASDTFNSNVNYTASSAQCYKTGSPSTEVTNAVAGTASGKTWSGISVPLTTDVPSVTCEAEVTNASTFVAYLQSLQTAGPIQCSSVASGSAAVTSTVINTVCAGTTMTVYVGNSDMANATDKITVTSSSASQTDSGTTSIAASGTTKIYVTVATSQAAAADGDILVSLPFITHTYSTVSN